MKLKLYTWQIHGLDKDRMKIFSLAENIEDAREIVRNRYLKSRVYRYIEDAIKENPSIYDEPYTFIFEVNGEFTG